MKRRSLTSRFRKVRDLIDYDYDKTLPDEAFRFLEAFTASYYGGAASDVPGSVDQAEAAELAAARRRDAFGGLSRADGNVSDLVEVPPYRSPFAEGRKKHRRAMKARKGRCA